VISAKNVTKAYAGDIILDSVDFKIGNNRKIGIVGKNGCGKTTLLKLITETEEISSGNIDIQNEEFGYIPQEFNFPDKLIGEYLEEKLALGFENYKIDILVTQMDFHKYDPYQEIKTLSEGQKMKLKLIETMLLEPTTLFIDEPTNHLDIEGIMWFENYIKNLNKTVVMISHDRSFLNNTVDEIWEIENKKILRFVGDYDNYKMEKLKLIDKWDAEYTRFLQKKRQLEQLIENVRKIKDGKKRGRAVESAKKRFDREITLNTKEKYSEKKIKSLNFDTDVRSSKLMVRLEDLSKSYGTKEVFNNLSFELRGKEKVWLFGPNGMGKSTLVKLIMGEEKPTAGNIKLGENIKIGYFAQKQTRLTYTKNLLDQFMETTHASYGGAISTLRKFLFDKDTAQKRISQLSPGERARFAFAIFAYNDYDLLILDEPTNHLDIETKEVIEQSLSSYDGTLLLVSHDRYFVEEVGITKVLNLRDGKLTLC